MNSNDGEMVDPDIFDEMERVRDSILDSLTPMDKAALFQDYDDFREKYLKSKIEDYYD